MKTMMELVFKVAVLGKMGNKDIKVKIGSSLGYFPKKLNFNIKNIFNRLWINFYSLQCYIRNSSSKILMEEFMILKLFNKITTTIFNLYI